ASVWGRVRTMATVKCLACGHDNHVGEESCASCSSSLNLKLCSACEAINAHNAERCHSCKALFRAEPEVMSLEMNPPHEALVVERTPRSKSAVATLAVLSLVLAGLAYYVYAPLLAAKTPQPAAKVEAAEEREPGPRANPEVAPSEPSRLPVAEPRQAPPPAVSGKIAPSRSAPAPSRSTPLPEPRRTTAAVTHTPAASGHAA